MRFVIPMSLLCSCAVLASACSSRQEVCCVPTTKDVVKQSYVHKYGIEVPGNEWSNRGQNGKVVSTLKSGVVVTKNYVDGYLEGETTYTFPHSGAIQKIETFSDGQLVMEQEMFPTGDPKKQIQYERPNRTIITVWYENGIPHFREEYRDGKLIEGDYYSSNNQVESKIDEGSGTRINRDEFGQLLSRDRIQHGQLAMRTLYYPNGSPKEIIPYVDGKVDGQKKTFLPGGEPRTVEEWSEDKQEGITVVYQNGEKIAEVPYLNGIKSGMEQRFKDGRFIVEEFTWKNGKKHGPCYNHVGEETHVSWYYEGQEVSKRQYERLTNPRPR